MVVSASCTWFVRKLCVINGKMSDDFARQLYLVCEKTVCV